MNQTQEERVLEVLKAANGGWVNGQQFLRVLYLSQYHRAIWNLQNHKARYGYEGVIEASPFKDEFNFKSYRLICQPTPTQSQTPTAQLATAPATTPTLSGSMNSQSPLFPSTTLSGRRSANGYDI